LPVPDSSKSTKEDTAPRPAAVTRPARPLTPTTLHPTLLSTVLLLLKNTTPTPHLRPTPTTTLSTTLKQYDFILKKKIFLIIYFFNFKEDEATKRSVLDALWRAFQAITGGALTIGGQLAKGSGAILQAKGKLIASAGPVVSEFGKTIATKAAVPGYAPSYVSYATILNFCVFGNIF
jgi:hypothetical protein